jgi:hypothetical protein
MESYLKGKALHSDLLTVSLKSKNAISISKAAYLKYFKEVNSIDPSPSIRISLCY